MFVSDDALRINLCGAAVTPFVLALIGNALESGKQVVVENAAMPCNGPGAVAMQIGYRLRETELHDELKETGYGQG